MTFKESVSNIREIIMAEIKIWTESTPRNVSVSFLNNGVKRTYSHPNKAMQRREQAEILGGNSVKIVSHARLMPPLSMKSMLDPFSVDYTIGSWITLETVQEVRSNVLWEQRTELERELLTLMGRKGVRYFQNQFKIVKVSWKNRKSWSLPFARIYNLRRDSSITIASYMKHIEGDVPYHYYADGLTNSGDWELTGHNYVASPALNYRHTHPYTKTSGSVYIALPATVDRYVDLTDPRNWAGIIE